MRIRAPHTSMAFVGVVVVLATTEVGLRVLGSALPDPVLWPSIEADIKVDQMSQPAYRPTRVVFMGDSTMESGVDPSRLHEFGVEDSSYNAALPWSTPLSMEVWFGEVVRPLLDPEIIYVGLAPPSGLNTREGDILYQGLLTAIRSQEESWVGAVAGWSELYKKRTLVRDLPVIFRRERVVELGLISTLGFQTGYLWGAIAAAEGGVPAIENTNRQMSEADKAALERLIRSAAQAHVQLVLVVEPFPCPADAGECVERFLSSTFYRGVEALANAQEVPLLNVMQEPWPEGLFVDDRHLNAAGVDRFQRLVANSMADLGSK
ncbi:MAG: hypothetical protein WD651_02315 [Acidimicrobiia bacterium]